MLDVVKIALDLIELDMNLLRRECQTFFFPHAGIVREPELDIILHESVGNVVPNLEKAIRFSSPHVNTQ